MTTNHATNLSGRWEGQFNYPNHFRPEFFVANLIETAGLLGGSIHEMAMNGRYKDNPCYASVTGTRNGYNVDFIKQYEAGGRQHAVKYTGHLHADGQEIEGVWMIRSHWSGKFLMIRSSGLSQAIGQHQIKSLLV